MRRNGGSEGPVLLEAKEVRKTYRPKRRGGPTIEANQGISLSIRAGEVLAVLGPNGAGKTTFLRQVAGQLLPTSGSIRVCGVDVVAEPIEAKRRMSVIPQECTPYEALTVEEHVRYFGVIKGMDPRTSVQETAKLLTQVGLTEHRKKLIRELSGGLKRRVLIALALAGGSQLLLLDEPTTGLDPASRRTVWKVIETLSQEGRGVLLTTHYTDEAEFLADRVVIIAKGKILAEGTPHEIQSRAAARGRLELYGTDRLKGPALEEVSQLKRRWPVSLERPDQLRLAIPDPFSADSLAQLRRLADLGVKASLAPASLEDAYLSLVGEEAEA
jgi:ABC-2 type transport system ATP-binding protein